MGGSISSGEGHSLSLQGLPACIPLPERGSRGPGLAWSPPLHPRHPTTPYFSLMQGWLRAPILSAHPCSESYLPSCPSSVFFQTTQRRQQKVIPRLVAVILEDINSMWRCDVCSRLPCWLGFVCGACFINELLSWAISDSVLCKWLKTFWQFLAFWMICFTQTSQTIEGKQI